MTIMDLPAPSVLTQLPRPLQASTGRTQAGEVFSLVDSRKRKRHEVAVAVDGEGINIYNVQFPKLVTSYAVPPQSEFSCCPISIRLRDKESTAVKRYTYCAVQRPQFQIKAFFEETVAGSSAAPTISSSSYALNNSRSPVIYIGVIPATSSGSDSTPLFDLLVVHRDGLVRRLTANLETERWSAETSGSGSEEIAYAFLVDHEDARRALFRRRPDLAGLIVDDLSSSVGNVSSVLLLVAQAKGSLATMIYMFSVTANVVASGHSLRSSTKLQNLETVQLPSNEEPSLDVKDIQWSFHPGSAGLGLSFPRGYVNYDLSQFPPSRASSMIIADEEFSSVMRISPNSVIGAGKSSVAVYDTLYSSIQRSIPLRELPTSKSHGKSTSKTCLKFVGYFAKLGIALAIKENSLQAFDLSSTLSIRGTSVKRQRDGLLIDAIGRGVNLSSAGVNDPALTLGLKSAQEVHKWNVFKSELDKACKSKDGLAFDEAIVKRFGPSVEAQAVTDVHPEQITFILSRIFTVRQQDSSDLRRTSSQLEIVVWPEKTCNWLAKLGQLSTDHVKAAVLRANKPSILPPFEPGTVARALAEFDTPLKALTLMLSSSGLLDREELVHTLRIFLDEARARSAAIDLSSTMAISGIPNAEVSTDGTTPLQPAPTSTASGGASLENAFIGLNLTLARLHDYPTNQIISGFRSTLSNTDTLAIIHHLRVSLATGGYTARFTEEPPVPLEAIKAAPPLSLEAIIDLMNASVDAIGPSGWISAVEFAGAAVNEIEMISHMQSEISAALAGIEEAAYMKGIIGEFVRYGYRVSKSTSSSTSLETGATSNATAAVTISAKDITMTNSDYDATSTTITNPSSLARINREYDSYGKLWETHTFPKAGEEDGKMLPLSLNTPESEVSRTKIQKSTGEVKQRTKREIAYLQRQAVPDYSVVRIHL